MPARRTYLKCLVVIIAVALQALIAWMWWPLSHVPIRTVRLAYLELPRGFSADSRAFFTFRYDGRDSPFPEDFSTRLWDVESGHLRLELAGVYGWQVHSCDGKMFAAAQRQSDLRDIGRVWDTATGAVIVDLGPTGPFFSGEFTSDGTKLVQVIETEGKSPGKRTVGHRYDGFAIDPDGPRSQVYKGSVKVWDLAVGQVISQFDLPNPFRLVEFGGDGTVVVVGAEGTVCLWDALTGKKHATLPRAITINEGVVRMSPDNKVLATGLLLWDVDDPFIP